MFIPDMFKLSEPNEIQDLIGANGFGYLITNAGEGTFPMITAIPMFCSDGVLFGHVARPNPHGDLFDGTHPTRALFQGAHGYISPTWYPNPEVSVPTWNYVVAIAEGRPERVEAPDMIDWILTETARQYEAIDGWAPSTTKPGYMDGMKRGITAFRMPVERLMGKAKLSQNKPVEVRDSIVQMLEERGETDLAHTMRRDHSTG